MLESNASLPIQQTNKKSQPIKKQAGNEKNNSNKNPKHRKARII